MNIIFPICLLFLISPVVYFSPPHIRKWVTLGLTGFLLYFAYVLVSGPPMQDVTVALNLTEVGISSFGFSMHPYSKIAGFAFALVSALSLVYGLRVAKPSEQAVSIIAIASALGVSFAADFITFFMFWEALTFSVGIIVLLEKSPKALKNGLRFFVFQLTGGLMLLFGILLHYSASGSLLIEQPQAGLYLFIFGIGIKSAFIITYFWLPWCYCIANFPSSVVLAALSTKAAVYALSRIMTPNDIVMYIGVAMTIFGFTMALAQKDLRKLLAYHIISQVGYMVAGVGLATTQGIDGSLLHLLNHMLYKGLLFMAAGSILYCTGTENAYDLQGSEDKPPVWKSLPIPTIAAVCGALAIAGTPFFNGFVSKYILKYAFDGIYPASTLLKIASVGTALSFAKFLWFGFFKARADIIRKPLPSMNIAMLTVSALLIIMGAVPGLSKGLLPHATKLPIYTLSSIWGGLQFVIYGIVVFILLRKFLDPSNKPKLFKVLGMDPFWDFVGRESFCIPKAANAFDEFLNYIYEGGSSLLKRAVSFEFMKVSREKALTMAAQAVQSGRAIGEKHVEKVKSERKEEALPPGEKVKIFDALGWTIKNLNIDSLIMSFLLALLLILFFSFYRFL